MPAKEKIDPGSIARRQLAERFSKSLDASLLAISGEGEAQVNNASDFQNSLTPKNDVPTSPTEKDNNSLTREMIVTSEMSTSVSQVTSEMSTSVSQVTSETYASETLAASETLVNKNADETLVTSETLVNETLVTSETLVNETLVASETLVTVRFGEPIPPSLFLQILDHGFFELLKGVTSAAPILFYWAFTRQQSSVLHIVYKEAAEALNIPDSRITRAVDRIKTSDWFIVKSNREGLFIDLSPLIRKVKSLYPDLANVTSETLVVSSSSLLLKDTTTNIVTSETLVWKNIKPVDFRVLVDLLHFCKYSKKDLSLKLISAMAEAYKKQKGDLLNLALNLFYASSRATGSVSAKISYLLRSINEDWGTTATPIEEIEKIRELVSVFLVLREQNINDKSTGELKHFLNLLGKYPHPETSREQYIEDIKDVLAQSDDLFLALSQLAGRSSDESQGHVFRNPSTTSYI